MLDSKKRSRDLLKEKGYLPGDVESRVYGGRSSDLWQLFDLLAVNEKQVLFVQACGSDLFTHLKKYEHPQLTGRLLHIIANPNVRALIFSWRKRKVKRGGTAYRYALTVYEARIVFEARMPVGTIEWAEVPDWETII